MPPDTKLSICAEAKVDSDDLYVRSIFITVSVNVVSFALFSSMRIRQQLCPRSLIEISVHTKQFQADCLHSKLQYRCESQCSHVIG